MCTCLPASRAWSWLLQLVVMGMTNQFLACGATFNVFISSSQLESYYGDLEGFTPGGKSPFISTFTAGEVLWGPHWQDVSVVPGFATVAILILLNELRPPIDSIVAAQ